MGAGPTPTSSPSLQPRTAVQAPKCFQDRRRHARRVERGRLGDAESVSQLRSSRRVVSPVPLSCFDAGTVIVVRVGVYPARRGREHAAAALMRPTALASRSTALGRNAGSCKHASGTCRIGARPGCLLAKRSRVDVAAPHDATPCGHRRSRSRTRLLCACSHECGSQPAHRNAPARRQKQGRGPARIHGARPGHRVALAALALAQMRAPESRSAARLLRTTFDRLQARCPSSRFALAKRKPAPRRPGRPAFVPSGRLWRLRETLACASKR